VTSRRLAGSFLATLAAALLATAPAWARNPHCAGGIQYLTQALGDKQKGNLDDYHREISKAVQQLESCSSEDPSDLEAMGYLGWAYAEVDSAPAAGKAFDTAIKGLTAKGDKKKLDQVINNRDSFWATAFNQGIAKITAAQQAYNPYAKPAETDADKASKEVARKAYEDASTSLNKALALKPADPRTLRNLGAVAAFTGDYVGAEKYFQMGLGVAPGDSELTAALKSARINRANMLLDEKKYDEASAYYNDLIKTDPNNGDLWSGLGDAAFSQARTLDGAPKAAAFKKAADAYAKAADLRPTVPELRYNAGLCYENAGDLASAEAQFRAELKIKPDDSDALTVLSSVLADEKKFPEAVAMAQKSVSLNPKDKDRHHLLGTIYGKQQDNQHSRQSLLVYLALDKGAPSDKPTDASGAAGTKLMASQGKPDQIVLWEADGQKYETWFYWTKGQAYHFGGGSQLEKTDWSAALAAK
jgi:tetratricopeptide (TPR) repeat protein